MVIAKKINPIISEDEYLNDEKISDIKHEYIDGYVYAMSGASANHNRIAGNLFSALSVHLKHAPGQPYTSDMKVKIGSKYFYPDVLVDCDNLSGDSYFSQNPILIIEVLSKSTRQIDRKIKLESYLNIAQLQEYILIEQDFVDVEVIRRRTGWQSEHYFLGENVTFESVNLSVSVEDIYHRVDNSDVKEWLLKQAEDAIENNIE
ncbi:Uma2 family endonuclease [Acinetobacter puyangensis]|uniref:Endonuclease, Uma2 family (Restriction endonuclease fold) n=1 Tax=Acinetobacter puyangensis TaxID=1096779 RepID=A0A240EBL2_9GAMM|nr:Uma2 family endonuclease [Acinetobacter puyangensis]SNX45579.1 Endonuclease, Uma2 family (restriction endonuclease fold) [Acinetobacter puyangensis]